MRPCDNERKLLLTNHFFVSAYFPAIIICALKDIDLNLAMDVVIFFTPFCLPLVTNVIVTTLIVGRIWYLSPRTACKMRIAQFPKGTSRAAIDIVIESGVLCLAVQLIFVILFTIGHPAQLVVGAIAVQIYVRIPHTWKAENLL